MARKIEFIESYMHTKDDDYIWSDNHGELVRCKNCEYFDITSTGHFIMNCCKRLPYHVEVGENDYCSFARKKETENDED